MTAVPLDDSNAHMWNRDIDRRHLVSVARKEYCDWECTRSVDRIVHDAIAHISTMKVEERARLKNLADRFPYQFPVGYRAVCTIRPGWIPIVESLCIDVDTVLDTDGRSRFSWTCISGEDDRLQVMFPELHLLECKELIDECERFGVPLPWQQLEHQIEQLIETAARRAAHTCDACGDHCSTPAQFSPVRCRAHTRTVVPFVD